MRMNPVIKPDITRSLVRDVEVGEEINMLVPSPNGGGMVRVRLLSKSGKRARLHVIHPEEVLIEIDHKKQRDPC